MRITNGMNKEQKTKPLEIFDSMVTTTFCNYDETNWCEFSVKDRFEAWEIDLVRKTLEGNIPKRPYVYDKNSDPECPACEWELHAYYNETLKRFVGDNFCPECGQALEWEK